jgi:hypothetical protein
MSLDKTIDNKLKTLQAENLWLTNELLFTQKNNAILNEEIKECNDYCLLGKRCFQASFVLFILSVFITIFL